MKKKIRLHIVKRIPKKLIKPNGSIIKKGNPYVETVKFNLRIGQGSGSFSTSITLRKNIVALWILMMDKGGSEPYTVVQEFIDKVCLKRWTGETAKGMSDFITKCMIHSFLELEDYQEYKRIYLGM